MCTNCVSVILVGYSAHYCIVLYKDEKYLVNKAILSSTVENEYSVHINSLNDITKILAV